MSSFPTPRRILRETLSATPDNLLSLKNEVMHMLLMAEGAKDKNPAVIQSLALEAAMLEEKLGAARLEAGAKEDAATNFISAASCWVAAGKKTDALRALDRARELTEKDAMLRWIKNYTKQVEAMRAVT